MIRVMTAIGRMLMVQIDCADPLSLARFWGQLLHVNVDEVLGDPAHYVNLTPPADTANGVCLAFQRVPEPKLGKNRVHLDIAVDDVDRATENIEQLGGRRLASSDFAEHGYNWRVMADPEDNEFCLIFQPRDAD